MTLLTEFNLCEISELNAKFNLKAFALNSKALASTQQKFMYNTKSA